MLSKDFVMFVLIALLVAIPLSWWVADKWLQGFAYRISIAPSIFLTAGLFVMVITLLATGFQSMKAAIANPVKSLRTQ